MPNKEGFIVVQKSRDTRVASFNPSYRGVDRLVPWRLEDSEKGFNDPILDPNFADDDGFILTLELAQQVLQIFTQIVEPDDLEILFIRDGLQNTDLQVPVRNGYLFLGFDAAWDGSPFYSIVSDFPLPEDDGPIQIFRNELNENGLFDSLATAAEYLKVYLLRHPEHIDKIHVVWEVYLFVQGNMQAK